ncbi:MAG TPA: hypothetical protein VNL17_06435 [Verrucomicrobiae bacterium]|nr:hypothetical protein [Verrucomicrobiae bacterium]
MTTSKNLTIASIFTALLAFAVLARSSAAQSYNAATDFSAVNNPNGAWSYGWSYGVGSTFSLDPVNTNSWFGSGLSGWLGDPGNNDGRPFILHNGTANPITIANTTYQPGQLAEEGGESNRVSIIRWTASSSGTFTLAATFSGLSSVGDSSDVHVLHNGTSIFNSTVFGSPSPTSYSGTQSILAGDTIDFVVGNGGNGAFEDTTGLSATIVPEPGSFGLVGMGLGCLLSFRFLKRK